MCLLSGSFDSCSDSCSCYFDQLERQVADPAALAVSRLALLRQAHPNKRLPSSATPSSSCITRVPVSNALHCIALHGGINQQNLSTLLQLYIHKMLIQAA